MVGRDVNLIEDAILFERSSNHHQIAIRQWPGQLVRLIHNLDRRPLTGNFLQNIFDDKSIIGLKDHWREIRKQEQVQE